MNTPYGGATYKGEYYSFPNLGTNPSPDEADYYRCSAPVDRSYEEYCLGFGFDLAIFAGRTVLDLGAGTEATFATQAAEHGLRVISVNPNWQDATYRQVTEVGRNWHGDGRSVAAVAQELPFADESFDAVISLWGVPAYLPGTKAEYRRAFQEIHRVLKPTGVGIMFPISRLTVLQPSFEEVLGESFTNYQLLDQSSFPKLFVTKQISPENAVDIDTMRRGMDRPTPAFII